MLILALICTTSLFIFPYNAEGSEEDFINSENFKPVFTMELSMDSLKTMERSDSFFIEKNVRR